MSWIKTFIFKKLLSEWIPFSWIDGKKKQIGRFVVIASTFLAAVKTLWPQYLPEISQADTFLGIIAGLVGVEIAEVHDEVKEKHGFGA